ncbi:unnamed protein product, partial [marine sediment metagenome]
FLSSKYFDENIEIGDRIKDDITPSVEYQIIKNSIEQQIRNLLDKLDEKEAIVIKLRFGLDDDRPRTLQEIGDKLKLTRTRTYNLVVNSHPLCRLSYRGADLQ